MLGGGKTTERLLVRISIETHKTSPDFGQTAGDKAKIELSRPRRNWLRRVHRNGPITLGLAAEFGDISLQEVMAARLSGLGFRRRLRAGSVFMDDRGIVYQNLVPG